MVEKGKRRSIELMIYRWVPFLWAVIQMLVVIISYVFFSPLTSFMTSSRVGRKGCLANIWQIILHVNQDLINIYIKDCKVVFCFPSIPYFLQSHI